MTSPASSHHWLQNPVDNSIDGHFPLGDKPTTPPAGPDFDWMTIGYPIINALVVNHSYSEAQRAHITGGDAGLVTIGPTLDQVSGDNYATEDWSLSADNLVHPANSNQGAGVFRVPASYLGVTKYSPNRSWAYLPPPEVQVKWNPGHYLITTGTTGYNPAGWMSDAQLDEARDYGFLGIQAFIGWKYLEGSRGNYSIGFNSIDAFLARCVSRNLRLIVYVTDVAFSTQNPLAVFPSYMATEDGGQPAYAISAADNKVYTKRWRPAGMARIIAYSQAMATHYDTHARVEGFSPTAELTLATDSSLDPTYSQANYITQLHSLIDNTTGGASPPFARTTVWLKANYGIANLTTDLPALIEYMFQHRMGIAGPDVITGNSDHSTNGMRVMRKMGYNGSAWIANAGLRDYRPLMPVHHDVQGPEMGGKEGSYTCEDIYQHSTININHDQHLSWTRKTSVAGTGTQLYYSNVGKTAPPAFFTPDVRTSVLGGTRPTVQTPPTCYPVVATGGT